MRGGSTIGSPPGTTSISPSTPSKENPMTRVVRLVLAVALACAWSGGLQRAGAAIGPVDDPALIAKAKAEGTLLIYGAGQSQALDAAAKRFEATYGIKAAWVQMQGYAIPPRLMTEQRGGHNEADMVIGESGLETEQIKRAGFYAEFNPPETHELLAGTYDRQGAWIAYKLYTETICYNPEKLRAAGLTPPRTWDDLAAREWQGKFSLFNGSWEWFAAMKRFYGAQRAVALMRAYAANQPRITSSHQLGITLVSAGDVLAAANVYGYACLQVKDQGGPIELVNPNPTVIEVGTAGVLKAAPHPNAARLFQRWLLSRQTQRWALATLGQTPSRKDVKNDPRVMNPRVRYLISDTSDLDVLNADIKEFNVLFNIPV
jgi:iron(III) transport system substrate-binding protein